MFVERAFINYRVTDSLVFSAGRLPTIDGSPTHLPMGQSSMGSYPIFSYNAILDGVALTHKANVFGGKLTSRAVFTPFTSFNHGANKAAAPTNTVDGSGGKVDSHAPMIAVMADFDKTNTPIA